MTDVTPASVQPKCGRGHPGQLGRLCPQCAVIRYREADEAEAEVARLRAENAALRDRVDSLENPYEAWCAALSAEIEEARDE